MDLTDLHLAVVIAREGSLAAAAHVLGVTQPTLSKAVARLEREARVRLFERVARGMRPTEIGLVFLERARQLDIAAGDLHAELRDLRQARAGLLRFGIGQGVPDHWVTPVVSALADDGVRFEISAGMPDALLPRVALGELEYSLSGMSGAPGPGLDWEPLAADPIIVLAPLAHPLARSGKAASWADLAAARWIVPAANTSSHNEFIRNFGKHGLTPQATVLSHTSERELALGVALNALVLMSRSRLTSPGVREAFVVLRPVGGWPSTRRIALVFRKGGYLSPAAQRAMTLTREVVRKASRLAARAEGAVA